MNQYKYFSGKQTKRIQQAINEIDSSIDDNDFSTILLNTYNSYFRLQYSHLAIPNYEWKFIRQDYAGDNSDLWHIYQQKEDEDNIFKNEKIKIPPITTPIHIDLETWHKIKNENPVWNLLSKYTKNFEIISAIHPSTIGLIGLKIDGKAISNELLNEHIVLSPYIVNAYCFHRKITAYRDLNLYLYTVISGNSGKAWAFCDHSFNIISGEKKIRAVLDSADISWSNFAVYLSGIYPAEMSFNQFTFSIKTIRFNDSLSIKIEPVFIDRNIYYKVSVDSAEGHLIFTKREHEILEFVKSGFTNKQIADRLEISVETVKKHISNLFKKTGARNRTELSHLKT